MSCMESNNVKIIPFMYINTKQCDITTTILTPSQVMIDDQKRWTLLSLSQNVWHLRVSMGNSWKFAPNSISSITFTINGLCGIHNPDCDALFAFSSNGSKYFAGSIRYDQYGRNKISPSCNKLLHSGNVEEIVSNSTTLRRESLFHDDQQSIYPSLVNNIKFPAQYTIINNPIDNTTTFQFTHSYTNIIQSCTWIEAFDTDSGIDFYLSPDSTYELLNIYSITIISTGLPTSSPTNVTLNHSTIKPSLYPTLSPEQSTTNPTTGLDKIYAQNVYHDILYINVYFVSQIYPIYLSKLKRLLAVTLQQNHYQWIST